MVDDFTQRCSPSDFVVRAILCDLKSEFSFFTSAFYLHCVDGVDICRCKDILANGKQASLKIEVKLIGSIDFMVSFIDLHDGADFIASSDFLVNSKVDLFLRSNEIGVPWHAKCRWCEENLVVDTVFRSIACFEANFKAYSDWIEVLVIC